MYTLLLVLPVLFWFLFWWLKCQSLLTPITRLSPESCHQSGMLRASVAEWKRDGINQRQIRSTVVSVVGTRERDFYTRPGGGLHAASLRSRATGFWIIPTRRSPHARSTGSARVRSAPLFPRSRAALRLAPHSPRPLPMRSSHRIVSLPFLDPSLERLGRLRNPSAQAADTRLS